MEQYTNDYFLIFLNIQKMINENMVQQYLNIVIGSYGVNYTLLGFDKTFTLFD